MSSSSATDAVAGAIAAQHSLAAGPWPEHGRVRVRMGMHSGQGVLGGDSYVGIDVHRAARIAAAAHGGQVLLSDATRALVDRQLPDGVILRDIGSHWLKDLATAERLFQLVIPGLPHDYPPIASAGGRSTNIQLPLTSFIGREEELSELEALVRTTRLVTVIGTGGTGKTRVILQVGSRLANEWRDGAWVVELAPIVGPALVVPAVARSLGVRDDGGRPLLEAVIDYLRPKHLLLLLDNCEHLVQEVAKLSTDLAAACPELTILASSREGIGIAGESLYQLPSLRVPDALPDGHADDADAVAAARGSEAVRLFADRAAAMVSGFTLTSADFPAAVEICRRLDGIPLAIELAAARVAVLSVQDIAARLGDQFRLLTGGSRSAMPRQQTLEATIDWSWDLLDDAERRAMCRMSVFVGGCTVESAAAVAVDPDDVEETADQDRSFVALELLARLAAKSLVVVDRGSPTRYRQLESIRLYARERLAASGDTSRVRRRHLDYFAGLVADAAPRLRGPELPATLRRLDPEAENLRAAIEWALDVDLDTAMRMCVDLAIYGRARSLSDGFQLLTRVAARIEPNTDADATPLVAHFLAAAANSAWMVGSASVGLRWAERALAISLRTDDRLAKADALTALAITSMFMGLDEGVTEWTDEANRIYAESGDWTARAFSEAGTSQWEAERGNVAGAAARLASAAQAAERSGSPEVIAFTALSRGRVAGIGGRVEEAREAFATAIEAYGEIGDDGLVLVARSDLAHALRHNGLAEEAVVVYRETLPEWQHTGNRGAIANQLESVAMLAAERQPDKAVLLLSAASGIREAADAPRLTFEQIEFETTLGRLRDRMDGAAFERALDEGRGLGADDAGSLAIGLLDAEA